MIRITEATIDDIETLVNLGEEMHKESRFKTFSYSPEKVYSLIQWLINDPDGILLVAKDDDKIIGGFIGGVSETYYGFDKYSFDCAIFVLPDRRKSKAGYLLIKEYIKQAKSRNVKEIRIGTTTNIDPYAFDSFIKKMGFECVGYNYKMGLD